MSGRKKSISMTFSVLELDFTIEKPAMFNLSENLNKILIKTETVKDRMMILNEQEAQGDCDFIPNFRQQTEHLFGSFARLKAGQSPVMLAEFLNQKTVEINDIVKQSADGTAGVISQTVFFCVFKNLIVMSSAHVNRKALETYFNWILRKNSNKHDDFKLSYKKNTTSTVPIGNIKSIQLGDVFLNSSEFQKKSHRITLDALKHLLSDVNDLNDFKNEDIVEAVLTLKINKKAAAKAKTLDTTLRIVDGEDVIITGRDGKIIRGSMYEVKAKREIEQSGSGYYNEQAIESEMRQIIKAVINEQVVT